MKNCHSTKTDVRSRRLVRAWSGMPFTARSFMKIVTRRGEGVEHDECRDHHRDGGSYARGEDPTAAPTAEARASPSDLTAQPPQH